MKRKRIVAIVGAVGSSLALAIGVGAATTPAEPAKAPASPGAGEPEGRIPIRFYLANVRTSSSAEDKDAGRYAFAGFNALDEVDATIWKEGADGPGILEWVQLTFSRPMRITGIGITPAPKELNRPTAFRLEYADDSSIRVAVGDGLGERRAVLTAKTTKTLKIRIDDVHIGPLHEQTAVADIHLYGAPVPYADPDELILASLEAFVDSGAYHTRADDLETALFEARLKRIEVAWHVAQRGVEAFATEGERPLEPIARLLFELGDVGHRVLIREAETLTRDPALGATSWVMRVHQFWYHAAFLNECYRGTLDVRAKGHAMPGAATGAAWHGCASLLRNGDVRGLARFAARILDGGGPKVLARRGGIATPLRLPALRTIEEALAGRHHLRAFKAAFKRLRARARGKDAAFIGLLDRAAHERPVLRPPAAY